MKSVKAQISVAIVCIVLGLMLAYQFKAIKHINTAATNKTIEDLKDQLSSADKQKKELENSIQELEKQKDQLEQSAANNDGTAKYLKENLDEMKIFAGLTDVQGPGIVVTIAPLDQNLNNNVSTPVDYLDLIAVVNELNATGAEAIMINNQRIVSRSFIRSVGDNYYVTINGERFSAFDPFTIKAIGDSASLQYGLMMPEGVGRGLQDYYDITTQKVDNMKIFKYKKVLQNKYAVPVKEGE